MEDFYKSTANSHFGQDKLVDVETRDARKSINKNNSLYLPYNQYGPVLTAPNELPSNSSILKYKVPRMGLWSGISMSVVCRTSDVNMVMAPSPFSALFSRIELRTKSDLICTVHPQAILDYDRNVKGWKQRNNTGLYSAYNPVVANREFQVTCFIPFNITSHPSAYLDTRVVEEMEVHMFVHPQGRQRMFTQEGVDAGTFQEFKPTFHFWLNAAPAKPYTKRLAFSTFVEPLLIMKDKNSYPGSTERVPITCPYPIFKTVINVFNDKHIDPPAASNEGKGWAEITDLNESSNHQLWRLRLMDGSREIWTLNQSDLYNHMTESDEAITVAGQGFNDNYDPTFSGLDARTFVRQYVLTFQMSDVGRLHEMNHNIYRAYQQLGFLAPSQLTDPTLEFQATNINTVPVDYAVSVMHYYHVDVNVDPNRGKITTSMST